MFLGCWGCNVSWCNVYSGCCGFCLICDTCSANCCLISRMLVFSCRCRVLVPHVHSVVIRSTVFCTDCNFFMFVPDIIFDQILLPYSSVVLVMVVYVLSIVSLDIPSVKW